MKDLKISKELLSEVLKLEVVKHSLYNKRNNTFNITYMQSEDSLKANWMPVNVYEFAFKCKEWAYKNRYDIWSITWGAVEFQNNDRYNGTERITEDTEIEAIIKACQWILNQQNNDTK